MKFILFTTALIISQISLSLAKVKFVSQMYRHGARTALHNVYDGKDQPHGRLTGVGMRQQYQLGQILRQKYITEEKLLDEQFNFDQIHIFSADQGDRLLQSASSNLLGFYPMGTGLDIFPNVEDQYLVPPDVNAKYYDIGKEAVPLKFQPPPIHNTSTDSDELMYPHCKNLYVKLAEWIAKPKQLLAVNKFLKETKSTVQQLTEVFGEQMYVWDIVLLYDTVTADIYQGRPLPEGFTDQLYYDIMMQTSYLVYFVQQDREELDIYTSNYFRQMLQNWDDNINQKFDLKWDMVSGHDSNLFNYLPALNITSSKCVAQQYNTGSTDALNCEDYPNFASNLIIELNEDDDSKDLFVKVNYNGKYQNLCEKEDITCDYDEFVQRIMNNSYSLEEINEKCGNKVDEEFIASQISQSFLDRIKKLSEEKEGKLDQVEFMRVVLHEISKIEQEQEVEFVESTDSYKFLGKLLSSRNLEQKEEFQQKEQQKQFGFESQVVYGLSGLILIGLLNLLRRFFN